MSDVLLDLKETHSPMEGVEYWVNPRNRFFVVDLEYKAHPLKRQPEWLEIAKRGMPKAEFDREYGKNWVVYDGKPVYQDYNDSEYHHLARGPIKALRRAKLISGWDSGPTDVNMAWVLGMVSPGEPHLTIIDEHFVDDGDADGFLQVVNSRLRLEWYKLGGFSIHVADQSVFTPTRIEKRAFADLMRQHGFSPIAGEISFAKRRQAVERLLITSTKSAIDNQTHPHLRVHERCTAIRESLKGGYCYPKASSAGEQYRELPMKNKFSHLANAVEYICSRIDLITAEIPYATERLPVYAVI